MAYDPAWRQAAADEALAIERLLSDHGAIIEHVGSTAVDGMAAKPILDMMVGLREHDDVDQVATLLREAGWTDLGEAGVAGRRYLRRRGGGRDANVHVVKQASRHWMAALALRDYLRAHAAERQAYSEAKVRALAAGHTSLLAYSDAKSPLVEALVGRALAWAGGGRSRE